MGGIIVLIDFFVKLNILGDLSDMYGKQNWVVLLFDQVCSRGDASKRRVVDATKVGITNGRHNVG